MNTEQLVEKFFQFADLTLKEQFAQYSSYLKSIHNNFPKLNVTLQNAKNKNVLSTAKNSTLPELSKYYISVQEWIKKDDLQKILTTIPWEKCQQKYQELFSELPDKIYLPYLPLEQVPEIQGIKIIKNLRKIIYNFKFKSYSKRILKKSNGMNGRELILRDFFEFYLLIPLIQQIYNEYNKFLSSLAHTKHQLHVKSENLKNDILLTQNIESEKQYWKKFKDQDLSKKFTSYKNEVLDLKNLYSSYKKDYEQISIEFLNKIKIDISDKLKISGSPFLTKREYKSSAIAKAKNNLIKKQNKAKIKWEHHFNGDNEEWLKDLELSDLQLMSAILYESTLNIILHKTQSSILPIFEDIKNEVTATLKNFEQHEKFTEEKLRSTILVENRNLIRSLRQKKLPALTDAIIQANYNQAFGGFFQRIQNIAQNLSDEHSVFTKKDLKNIPPQSDIVDIPLKELVEDEILAIAFKSREQLVDKNETRIQNLLRKITNLDQIVEFNLEAAYNMLIEDDHKDILEQAQKIATDGLERTQSNIEELQSYFLDTIDESTQFFSEIAYKLEIDIQKLGDNEKNLDLKIRLARAKTKEKLVQTRKMIWQKVALLLPEIIHISKNYTSKIRKEYLRIRKVTGLGPQISTSEATLTQFLIDTQRKTKKMPYIYQRLFRLDPLEEKRFFYGRSEQMNNLKEDIEDFKNGNQTATAIVGEKGNGKTTILKFAEKEFFKGFIVANIDLSATVYEEKDLLNVLSTAFNLKNVNSIEDLEINLLENDQKRICVIENLHNLFLRIINGFDSLEKLLLLISKTRHKIFWIISCGHYAWEYLDRVIKISDYFKRTIELKPLTIKEVKDVILNRHQVSGYGLSFQASEKVKKSRAFKKLGNSDEQQEYLKELLFDELANVSGGNIKSAILFWLSVLDEFDEEKINVADKISMDYSHIYQLPVNDLFSLAAFIGHEYLTEEEHAMIFNQEINESKLIISRLYKRGYLDKTDNKYSVYPLLYRPVIKVLKSKNILL